LQQAMLGEISSDRALEAAALQWNRYAEARWPEGAPPQPSAPG
jgi:putative chitobiose transport system substrate-binding protein